MALMHCHFFSDVLGLSCTMDVILPQKTAGQIGMEGRADREQFPVLYLLHGLSDDHSIWQRRTVKADDDRRPCSRVRSSCFVSSLT